jgi:hypothetical protein
VIRRIAEGVDNPVPDEMLEAAVFNHDAANLRRGLVPSKGNLDEGGRSSSWREYAREWEKRVLHDELVDVVADLGYEADDCFGFPPRRGTDREALRLDFRQGSDVGDVLVGGPKTGGWKSAGPAMGKIDVPAGALVRLRVRDVRLSELHAVPKPTLASVDILCVAGNRRVVDATLRALELVPNLRELDLARTRITDKAVKLLPVLPNLTCLSVVATEMTAAGVEALRRRWPACEVFGP